MGTFSTPEATQAINDCLDVNIHHSSITKLDDNGTFLCYYVESYFEDYTYIIDTTKESLSVDENTTTADLKAALIAHLETVSKYEPPILGETSITE